MGNNGLGKGEKRETQGGCWDIWHDVGGGWQKDMTRAGAIAGAMTQFPELRMEG